MCPKVTHCSLNPADLFEQAADSLIEAFPLFAHVTPDMLMTELAAARLPLPDGIEPATPLVMIYDITYPIPDSLRYNDTRQIVLLGATGTFYQLRINLGDNNSIDLSDETALQFDLLEPEDLNQLGWSSEGLPVLRAMHALCQHGITQRQEGIKTLEAILRDLPHNL